MHILHRGVVLRRFACPDPHPSHDAGTEGGVAFGAQLSESFGNLDVISWTEETTHALADGLA